MPDGMRRGRSGFAQDLDALRFYGVERGGRPYHVRTGDRADILEVPQFSVCDAGAIGTRLRVSGLT